jgi:hypothetical protein
LSLFRVQKLELAATEAAVGKTRIGCALARRLAEPIVCGPHDAIVCFLRFEIDVLVQQNVVVEPGDVPMALIDTVRRAYVARCPAYRNPFTRV